MFVDIRDCSLKVVGVPVKIPVRLNRMIRWEDLNSWPPVCMRLLLLSARFNWALVACTGVLFFL